MRVHNRIEDLVLNTVHEIFDERETEGSICTCSQCRMDVACYVLNRISPEYIVSSRGLAHMEADYHSNVQKIADVVKLVNEGVDIVSRSKRPNFDHKNQTTFQEPEGPLHSFPIISGRLFNGQNFAPFTGKKVSLFLDDKLVEMLDPNWINPYSMVDAFPGNFMFWPFPLKADEPGVAKVFSFSIKMDDPDYSDFCHRFELTICSEPVWINALEKNKSFHIQDLHLFSDDMDDGLVP